MEAELAQERERSAKEAEAARAAMAVREAELAQERERSAKEAEAARTAMWKLMYVLCAWR